MAVIERETRIRDAVRDLPWAVIQSKFTAGLVAALMGVASPTLLVYHAKNG